MKKKREFIVLLTAVGPRALARSMGFFLHRQARANVRELVLVCSCQGRGGRCGKRRGAIMQRKVKRGLVSPKGRRKEARLIKWPSPRSVSRGPCVRTEQHRQKDLFLLTLGRQGPAPPNLVSPSSIDQPTDRSKDVCPRPRWVMAKKKETPRKQID